MKFFLLKMKVNGIKSIDKEVTLNFYNKTLQKNLDTTKSHVKAIYGTNGAGKTGIIYAVDIYRKLLLQQDYIALGNSYSNNLFSNLINQKTNKYEIQMTFAVTEKDGKVRSVYTHYVVIEKDNGIFLLNEEKLVENSVKNVDVEKQTIFHVERGEVNKLIDVCKNKDEVKTQTMNLLQKQSFVNIIFNKIVNSGSFDEKNEFDFAIVTTEIFSANLTVFLQDSDTNYIDLDAINSQYGVLSETRRKINDDKVFYQLLSQKRFVRNNTQKIEKKKFEEYKKDIASLCSFIKVFKNDLVDIEIKKEENGEYFECDNIMVYEDGRRINKKYESTGIRKIIELYAALCDVEHGKIVFIDEFDANIHDVLLVKLIQYMVEYASGQFVFTTHNLAPMEVLQKYKHSIDFLSADSRIVSWIKNGNHTAASQYSKGFIEYSPFNIEPFSFLGVFGE